MIYRSWTALDLAFATGAGKENGTFSGSRIRNVIGEGGMGGR